jgi:carboxypeptidase C (cathepsin A)
MSKSLHLGIGLLILALPLKLHGQQAAPAAPPSTPSIANPSRTSADAKTKPDETTKSKQSTKTPLDDEPIVTHHKIQMDGESIAYTVTTGLIPVKDSKGEIEAKIFFIAYTRDQAGVAPKRPLLFSFNGGPGSASVWLHLGALGPRRVFSPDEPIIPAPPYRLVDNEASWLDKTDLVFIDPVGTGYSRAAKPELMAKFHSLRGDITSVGEFIRMYLSRYERWASPLYLIGESYGTTRAAGLAGHLIDQGIAFNGLILVSCALDFQAFVFGQGNDLPFLTYLPSYTATAWYHKRLPPELQQRDLPAVLTEVERWTDHEYASILARGDRLSGAEREQAAAKLSHFTGLTPSEIDAHNLRIGMSYFCSNLLKHDRRSLGRFDSRFQGIESSPASEQPSLDPSLAAVRAPYTSTVNNYFRLELGYKTDVPYYILGEGVGRWDWQRDMGFPSTTDDLRDAMTKNPHMKVLIASGYYDLATPYRAVEHTLSVQQFDPVLRRNIRVEHYDAGHMMYVHGPSLHKFKRDGMSLLDWAKAR